MTFDRILTVDFSASARPKRGKDAIWIAEASAGGITAQNLATRDEAEAILASAIETAEEQGARLLIGVDFALGYPAGFAEEITGGAEPLALWDWLGARISDAADNRHNLREIAAEANRQFPGGGPFWGNGAKEDLADLPRQKPALPPGLAEFRRTELAAKAQGLSPKSCWQLAGAGAVGAQSLVGLALLARLRARFGAAIAVWPFEDRQAPVTIAEIYPSILRQEVAAETERCGIVPDEAQMRLMAEALWQLNSADQLAPLFELPAPEAKEEGWILGVGHELALRAALPARAAPPRLRDDCFAMPQGVDWVPVDEALARLRGALKPLTRRENLPIGQALGRVMAAPCRARRSNPPRANSAVDGYGFAHAATGAGVQRLPLLEARAAAGQPFEGRVPEGAAIRILTGAVLPQGVDTVVLEEDTGLDGGAIVFDGPIKPGSNARAAGEDVPEGADVLGAGHRLRPPDLALLAALGIGEVPVFGRLRVGVLSTGDEILPEPASPALPHQIWDANRPMLLALAERWGYAPVDLGHVRDDPARIRARLDEGAEAADVILTSGGASAGDEDHVSALLRQSGTLSSWRIALKPGRPLALALWGGAPVFGLPGNPVAAMVCALIFARPALSLMAGAGWAAPFAMTVPAAFRKSKKPGRREYLRARLNEAGAAEVFASEGSGRISGLSWAEGLVELPDEALDVAPGSPVRFMPYSGFGL